MNGRYTMYGIENRKSKIGPFVRAGGVSLNSNGNTTGSRRSQRAVAFQAVAVK